MVACDDLLEGRLIPILPEYDLASFNVSAVFPATQRRALKVRTLIEFLVDKFSEEPAWDKPLLERGWVS